MYVCVDLKHLNKTLAVHNEKKYLNSGLSHQLQDDYHMIRETKAKVR